MYLLYQTEEESKVFYETDIGGVLTAHVFTSEILDSHVDFRCSIRDPGLLTNEPR